MRQLTDDLAAEFRRYKALAEGAIAQLDDPALTTRIAPDGNSIAILVWHIAGNLRSRFSDFLTSDGEKPWRDRDEEFVERRVTKAELLAHWEPAWETLFGALTTLEDGMFGRNVAIRGVPLRIDEALFRALAHISYHVGQIVLVAKTLQTGHWKYLSIPPGQSKTYNAAPTKEKPDAQAEALKTRR